MEQQTPGSQGEGERRDAAGPPAAPDHPRRPDLGRQPQAATGGREGRAQPSDRARQTQQQRQRQDPAARRTAGERPCAATGKLQQVKIGDDEQAKTHQADPSEVGESDFEDVEPLLEPVDQGEDRQPAPGEDPPVLAVQARGGQGQQDLKMPTLISTSQAGCALSPHFHVSR